MRPWPVIVALKLSCAATVSAQPWVPAQGEGVVSITYQNYYVTGHFNPQGQENKNGATHAKALIAELDFGLTDTVGLIVTLPFISSKYTGPPVYFVGGIPTLPGPLDDGTYHGAFQDLRVEVRRLFFAGPIATAPFIGYTVPTHAYETQGEAVPGNTGRNCRSALPPAWISVASCRGPTLTDGTRSRPPNASTTFHPFAATSIWRWAIQRHPGSPFADW